MPSVSDGSDRSRGSRGSHGSTGSRRATRGDVLATVAILGAVGLGVATRPALRALAERPSPEACVALLDRYVELVARAADPDASASTIAQRKETAWASAGEARFARCEAELTREEVACGLTAGNPDELERCLP